MSMSPCCQTQRLSKLENRVGAVVFLLPRRWGVSIAAQTTAAVFLELGMDTVNTSMTGPRHCHW